MHIFLLVTFELACNDTDTSSRQIDDTELGEDNTALKTRSAMNIICQGEFTTWFHSYVLAVDCDLHYGT